VGEIIITLLMWRKSNKDAYNALLIGGIHSSVSPDTGGGMFIGNPRASKDSEMVHMWM
jgi:hypothetical protein